MHEPPETANTDNGRTVVVTALAITAFMGAFILRDAFGGPWIFKKLIATHDWPAAWVMFFVLLCMAVDSRSKHDIGIDAIRWLGRHPYQVAMLTWCVVALGALFVYQNHPLSMDEYAAWFQASVFAEGRLSGSFPPDLIDWLVPKPFQNQFLMVNQTSGEVASAYWPGFSLFLTPFMWIGAPWLCNPTIVAATVLVLWKFAVEIFEDEEARGWTLLLAIASPVFLVSGMSYYSMSAHLLLNLAYALLLTRPTRMRCLVAGAIGSWALVLHNPLPHVLFAIPWIIWLAAGPKRSLASLGWLLLGYLPFSVVLGLGWSLWLREMIDHAAIAVPDAGPAGAAMSANQDLVESARQIIAGLTRNFVLPNWWIIESRLLGLTKLWLWAAPALLVVAGLGWRTFGQGPLRVMANSAALTLFGYFFIPFDQGHGWGYRYFHSAWGTLPILAAAGIIASGSGKHPHGWELRRRIWLGAMLSIALLVPLRLYQTGSFITEHLAQVPPPVAVTQQVIMLHNHGYYALDLVQNDPWLRGSTTVMIGHNERDKEIPMLERYLPGCRNVSENEYGWICAR